MQYGRRRPRYNAYAVAARNSIADYVSSKSSNAVFMDTTTIHTALSLLLGDPTALTPMMLLDLANVVSTIITNDNIFQF